MLQAGKARLCPPNTNAEHYLPERPIHAGGELQASTGGPIPGLGAVCSVQPAFRQVLLSVLCKVLSRAQQGEPRVTEPQKHDSTVSIEEG